MNEKTTLQIFFEMMVMEEHGAQKKYEMAQKFADSPELKKILARLADEEAFHAQVLESELLKLESK